MILNLRSVPRFDHLAGLGTVHFSDVANDSMIADAVEWMYDRGISNGCGGGKYCPDDNVTRGQLALFLYRMGAQPLTQTNTNTGSETQQGQVAKFLKDNVLYIGLGLAALLVLGGRR